MAGRIWLFVAGDSPRAGRAEANVRRLVSLTPPDSRPDEIEVVDVMKRPDLAEEWSVLATPLAIHVNGDSTRRAVGDFSDLQRLADAIGLALPDDTFERGSV